MTKEKQNPLQKKLLSGQKIQSLRLKKNLKVDDLMENYFQAYNSARLNEAGRLLSQKMLDPKKDVTIALTLAGALTPAGISGMVISFMEAGFIDFIISTGANLYHDIHFALDLEVRRGSLSVDDATLWNNGIVRIYDIYLGAETLTKTDKFLEDILMFDPDAPQKPISSSELHYYIGKKILAKAKYPERSILAQAAKFNVPVYTSSPGDSTIGMNLANYHLEKKQLTVDPNLDVLETTAIVMGAKENGAILLGGGSPKNFYMQTQPMLWECLGIEKGGHDYFIQITMDSPQWGGLSGATPSEAVSWGKINLDELKNTVVVYADTTLAVPLLFSYAYNNAIPRKRKNLYLQREKLMQGLRKNYKGIEFWPDYNKRG